MHGFLLTLFSVLTLAGTAQTYWQQEVNYTIEVTLDDRHHRLRGYETFRYTNNSPDVLNELYIHLWPNAYRDGSTALAKQLYQDGTDLDKLNDSLKGSIDSLDFQVNGIPASWSYDPHHSDICRVVLAQALQPGASIEVSTPFVVHIPSGSLSRLGHIEQSYQITQWYPKPAVYDKNGWHAMPYLNQGEFYSEYGSFDVSITLPDNYVVGATGDLQTQSEHDFLDQKASETLKKLDSFSAKSKQVDAFPPSSPTTKTIRFTQQNVHDFAWFADKRYHVLKGEVELPHSGRLVTTWALFTPKNGYLWKNTIEYLNDGTYYYSKWNGDYPYNQVTAVDGTISAGGGMEYPNVTVIGDASSAFQLEIVIVHEVGHNWFYGILGSNERDHGWMDEGLNTLNEVRYIQTKYPDNTAFSDMLLGGALHFNDLDHHDLGDVSCRMVSVLGLDQPIETTSAAFTSMNYGVIMYQKTGLIFNHLRNYLGDALFDSAMQHYFNTWKFKHPQPEDLRSALETHTGKDLSWLFGDLIQTTKHIDYKIKSVRRRGDKTECVVHIKNSGQADVPYSVDVMQGDSVVGRTWVEPGRRKELVEVKTTPSTTAIVIDGTQSMPETFRQNNLWDPHGGMYKRFEKPKLEFLIGDNEADRSNAFWTPIIAGNYYDKAMLGVAVHNYGVPFNRFQYLLAPMYSFGRRSISGVAELSHTQLPANNFRISRIGLSAKTFKNDSIFRNNDSHYYVLSPYWTATVGNRKDQNKPTTHRIRLQGLYRVDVLGTSQTTHVGGFLQYDVDYRKPDHALALQFRTDYASDVSNRNEFGRSSLSVEYSYRYLKGNMKRWISLRIYGGGFWNNNFSAAYNGMYTLALNGMNGAQDIFVEDYYFGRGLPQGIWSQQRAENMGAFKTAGRYGTTDQWLLAGNFYFQLPVKPSIFGIFADVGTVRLGATDYVAFDTGLALKLGDVFGVYFPVYWNDYIENSFVGADYKERIRFSLHINLYQKAIDLGKVF